MTQLTELNKSTGTVHKLFKKKFKTANAIFSYCCANNNLIQFVTTTKNQQKLVVYRGRCYTLKRTNRNDKYWMCTERSRSCCGTLSTNLEATEVIRSSEHAESCPVTPPRILPSPAACRVETVGLREYTRPVMEIYDELASNASTSLENAVHFTQCTTVGPGNTHAYRQLESELKLTAERTTINPCSWSVPVQTNNHLEGWHNRMTKRARKHHLGFYQFLKLIIHEQGKTETVVQQMDDETISGKGAL
ncbi:hypothetical protein T03_803 [Trichinella britovi]|uniref:FLYWCH-type domain-containing protein n=1 Tax=Trichinella britovi TaxID=45882 RepID=A0A0V1D4R3_TRIBR|nr:hypothetical protein T03_803 [Trichinella britovi]